MEGLVSCWKKKHNASGSQHCWYLIPTPGVLGWLTSLTATKLAWDMVSQLRRLWPSSWNLPEHVIHLLFCANMTKIRVNYYKQGPQFQITVSLLINGFFIGSERLSRRAGELAWVLDCATINQINFSYLHLYITNGSEHHHFVCFTNNIKYIHV